MLHPSDEALALRDRDIPALKLLLDDQQFTRLLQMHWPHLEVTEARALYARYKPGTSCLMRFELKTSRGVQEAYAVGYGQGYDDKFEHAHQKTKCLSLPALKLVVYMFPLDAALPAIALLPTMDVARELGYDQPLQCQRLAYKPERRYVAKLSGENTGMVAKAYQRKDYKPAKLKAKSLKHVPVSTSELLVSSKTYRLLVFKWLPGELLRDVLVDTPGLIHAQSVGRALARLHATPLTLPVREVTLDQDRVHALVKMLGILEPRWLKRLCRLAQELDKRLSEVSYVPTTVHGDFYSKQVLISDRVHFLDFDELALGHPATDIGTFLAHLEVDHLLGRLAMSNPQQVYSAFLEGYRHQHLLPRDIGLYTAYSLLCLAPHCFRNRLPDWHQQTEVILERIEQLTYEGLEVAR
jgi:hypothetical protein